MNGYEILNWRSALTILQHDYVEEYKDIWAVLSAFKLKHSAVAAAGGGKSPVANELDSAFYRKGWAEKQFDIDIRVDKTAINVPTHKVDCYKNGIALEVEWNNKTPFFDRDLNNFRILFELRVVSVGVIVTRSSKLQTLFNKMGKGTSYGASTTHMNKLTPLIQGGAAGGCPVLVFGITDALYDSRA
jgi:hypothetical protein